MTKKTTYILVDVSGSMRDCDKHTRASAVNQAMRKVVEEVLPEISAHGDAENESYFAVLTFSSDSEGKPMLEWHIPKAKMDEVAEAGWVDIANEKFYGGTPTGAAIKELASVLSGNGDEDPDEVAPAILLISDGEPNGKNPTYEEALDYVNPSNPHFCRKLRYSNRIAIGIQVDESGRESLKKFGRLSSSLKDDFLPYYDCTDDNTEALKELIKTCTVALSENV